jgi:16S rRNA (guanine966-N2)-methyltransferase
VAAARTRGLRPTSARVREALFDILGSRVAGSDLLDVFAGTGAVGLEALSRGASRVVFIEAAAHSARLIRDNLRGTGLPGSFEVIHDEATAALDRLAAAGASFAIVFLDPPYATGASPRALERAARLVRPGGVLVIEHGARVAPGLPDGTGLVVGRRYRYGDSRLSVFHRPAAEAEGR